MRLICGLSGEMTLGGAYTKHCVMISVVHERVPQRCR